MSNRSKGKQKMADKDKTVNDPNKSLEGLHKVFGDMSKQMEALPAQISRAVTAGINTAVQQRENTQPRKGKSKEDDDEDNKDTTPSLSDLEKMSRGEFANYITKTVVKAIKKDLAPIIDGMETTVEETQKKEITAKFKDAKDRYPDFGEWEDEMRELINSRGFLEPDELYAIVRAKNPEKAAKLDEEAKAKAKEAESKEKKGPTEAEPEKPTFLGLMPTSGKGTSPGEDEEEGEEKKFNSTRDAAAAAYDELLGGVDTALIGENQ